MYPLPPMLKPTALILPSPGKSAFRVQVLITGSYSQKSTGEQPERVQFCPVPIYPLSPMLKPVE